MGLIKALKCTQAMAKGTPETPQQTPAHPLEGASVWQGLVQKEVGAGETGAREDRSVTQSRAGSRQHWGNGQEGH